MELSITTCFPKAWTCTMSPYSLAHFVKPSQWYDVGISRAFPINGNGLGPGGYGRRLGLACIERSHWMARQHIRSKGIVLKELNIVNEYKTRENDPHYNWLRSSYDLSKLGVKDNRRDSWNGNGLLNALWEKCIPGNRLLYDKVTWGRGGTLVALHQPHRVLGITFTNRNEGTYTTPFYRSTSATKIPWRECWKYVTLSDLLDLYRVFWLFRAPKKAHNLLWWLFKSINSFESQLDTYTRRPDQCGHRKLCLLLRYNNVIEQSWEPNMRNDGPLWKI